MIRASFLSITSVLFLATALFANDAPNSIEAIDVGLLKSNQVILLGERHDNPDHHKVQAKLVAQVAPAALVFEMLSGEQARRVTHEARQSEKQLEATLEWADSGWPDFAMYYPIFDAAPDAKVYGAQISRQSARQALETDVVDVFEGDPDAYGLNQGLPKDEQLSRNALQAAAHCNKLPEQMLPGMVMIQRLRDAELARVALLALADTGGPVVVITGNGHARTDWGVPAVLERVDPTVSVISLGQGEDNSPPVGTFDMVLSAPAPEREDPCAAFN